MEQRWSNAVLRGRKSEGGGGTCEGNKRRTQQAEGSRFGASEWRTSLSVADSDMKTDAGDPCGNKAKDPRE